MADIHGSCDDRFEVVRDALARNLDSGEELGASLVLDIDGETVVDMWGGFRDQARTVPWAQRHHHQRLVDDQDGDQPGRTVLVDRGELDVYAPVAKYWPEFAANGKEDIEVRHLLSHTSGVSGLGPAGRDRGPLRLGEVHLDARRPGAVVGAGHRVGLPRAELTGT